VTGEATTQQLPFPCKAAPNGETLPPIFSWLYFESFTIQLVPSPTPTLPRKMGIEARPAPTFKPWVGQLSRKKA
jgi:hypothetical protein